MPPVGRRTKRFVIGVVKCDPGRNERAPLSEVHFSRGIQNPRADGGSVYYLKGSGLHGGSRQNTKTVPGMSYMRFSTTSSIIREKYTHESLCSGTVNRTRVPRSGNGVRFLRSTLTKLTRTLPSPPICCCFVMTMDWSATSSAVSVALVSLVLRQVLQVILTYPQGHGGTSDLEQVV